MGREIKTRLDAHSKLTTGLYRVGEATKLQVCSASAQALQGGSLNGLKHSLCTLNLRWLQSFQFCLAQFVQLTVLSLCCKTMLVFSPTQSYCFPGKHLAVPFTSSAIGNLVSRSFLSHSTSFVQHGGWGMVHAKRYLHSGGSCFTASLVYFQEMDREILVLLQGKAAPFICFKANQDQSRLLIY